MVWVRSCDVPEVIVTVARMAEWWYTGALKPPDQHLIICVVLYQHLFRVSSWWREV